jgi:hypothetical protein
MSGNPAGRKPGTRNPLGRFMHEELLEPNRDKIKLAWEVALNKAIEGDMIAFQAVFRKLPHFGDFAQSDLCAQVQSVVKLLPEQKLIEFRDSLVKSILVESKSNT